MTNSYNYKEAFKIMGQYKHISKKEAVEFITCLDNEEIAGTREYEEKEKKIKMRYGNKHGLYLEEAGQAYDEIEHSGNYTYLNTVAKKLLDILGIIADQQRIDRAEHICYYTNVYMRAIRTKLHHINMHLKGYIHASDITEDMNGKKALLTGTIEADIMTIAKQDEKVMIVCKDDMKGWRTPKMRTRYYPFTIDSDLFIKLI